MPVTRPSILSSMALNSGVSSSIASSLPSPSGHALVGAARADDAAHRAASAAGSADSADCVASHPPVSATTTIEQRDDARARRETARSRSSRASVLFPTWTSVPSRERARGRSPAVAGSHPSRLLRTIASAPRSTTRTNRRSGAVRCSALHGVGERARARRARRRPRTRRACGWMIWSIALRQRRGGQVVGERRRWRSRPTRTASRTRAPGAGRRPDAGGRRGCRRHGHRRT